MDKTIRGFAQAGDTLVGVDFDEDSILPRVADNDGFKIGDFHGCFGIQEAKYSAPHLRARKNDRVAY